MEQALEADAKLHTQPAPDEQPEKEDTELQHSPALQPSTAAASAAAAAAAAAAARAAEAVATVEASVPAATAAVPDLYVARQFHPTWGERCFGQAASAQ